MARARKNPVRIPVDRPELKLLSVAQTSSLCEVDQDIVRGWCNSGRLKHLRLSSHQIRIRLSELDRFLLSLEAEVAVSEWKFRMDHLCWKKWRRWSETRRENHPVAETATPPWSRNQKGSLYLLLVMENYRLNLMIHLILRKTTNFVKKYGRMSKKL